jgi:hypothetical protein
MNRRYRVLLVGSHLVPHSSPVFRLLAQEPQLQRHRREGEKAVKKQRVRQA